MKSMKRNLKWAAKILSFLILLQSCTVYRSYTSTVDEAIATNNKVKLVIENNDPYKFKKLQRIEGEIFGLAHHNSDTYETLASRKIIPSEFQKSSFVQVYDNELNDIHVKNKGASLAINIGISALIIGAAVGLTYAALDDLSLGTTVAK